MPSTTSIALKAMKLAQTCGSVSHSMSVIGGVRFGREWSCGGRCPADS
jgi:hypothetical protein